ncbi:MAG: TetR/AcrR family transcriptional regulator [Rhodospirillaceae bacterium]|nr:TetR/AcrR family transcriptional regulator [Rhodospirillaceae bacterium]MCA8931896.1 TetR/AcrR family transcriptional regulator [Rhodospirillaceae bacterium]
MPNASPSPRRRRTQTERSAETRGKILAVTLDLVDEVGLRDTTTTLVAERAGVSRGALLHHFPSKTLLLQECYRTMLRQATEDIHAMAVAIDAGDLDIDGFLDALWEIFSGRVFAVTLEFITAARTDIDIMTAVRSVASEFNAALDEIWERFQVRSPLAPADRRQALTATLCLLRGMGVQYAWRVEPAYFDGLLDFWKNRVLTAILSPAPADGQGGDNPVPLRAAGRT